MQTMKIAEALNAYNGKTFVFGGKAAGRKNPKKELVTVRAEVLPRGIVKLFDAESGAEVLHSRTGVVIFAGPVGGQAAEEKPQKAPRKAAAKKAAPKVEKAEEKPAKKPGKAPANFIELAKSGNTEAARRYWARKVAEYEG
jgi:hypothetical protein